MSRTPTTEQAACVEAINSDVDMLKIEACAGGGKTSTLTMMAENCRKPSLYLAFNKVTADEAAGKFPKHVTCRTTHSLAYSAFGAKLRDKLNRPKGAYVNVAGTGSEIARFYEMETFESSDGVILPSAFLGLLAKETVARFEQSADEKIRMSHVPTAELKTKLKDNNITVEYIKDKVLKVAKKLWNDRTTVSSPVLATHDTYLKLFQLSKPIFQGYEVLYVDEFQDTTPCVLDIVMRQKGHMKIVAVGDARQAIYGWRGAINAMEMLQCPAKHLTKSFRYGQAVADIATSVLQGAMKITGNEGIQSVTARRDVVDKTQPYTRLFRTNSALLSAAVEEIAMGTPVALEIDVKDFVRLLESALALYSGNMRNVKHDKLVAFQDWNEMMGESKSDPELGRIVRVISDGNANNWIRILSSHINSKNPMVTFTTAHKSKGREWSQVQIESDFKSCYSEDGEFTGLSTEEQNLLYVAVTRAINVLEFNNTVEEYLTWAEVEQTYDKFLHDNLTLLKKDMEIH